MLIIKIIILRWRKNKSELFHEPGNNRERNGNTDHPQAVRLSDHHYPTETKSRLFLLHEKNNKVMNTHRNEKGPESRTSFMKSVPWVQADIQWSGSRQRIWHNRSIGKFVPQLLQEEYQMYYRLLLVQTQEKNLMHKSYKMKIPRIEELEPIHQYEKKNAIIPSRTSWDEHRVEINCFYMV